MKQTIRLTESQLSEMIQQSINEALEDESLWGGLSSIGSKMKNATSKMAKNAGNAMGNAWNRTKGAVSDAYNNAADNIKQGYNNVKKTYQVGSANQDAQTAIKNAINALNNLKMADQKMQQAGMSSIIGNKGQREAIENCLKALQGGGATSISNRFQNVRNAYTR